MLFEVVVTARPCPSKFNVSPDVDGVVAVAGIDRESFRRAYVEREGDEISARKLDAAAVRIDCEIIARRSTVDLDSVLPFVALHEIAVVAVVPDE